MIKKIVIGLILIILLIVVALIVYNSKDAKQVKLDIADVGKAFSQSSKTQFKNQVIKAM